MASRTANAATPASRVPTQRTSTPSRVVWCGSMASDLEIDHFGHDQATQRHPDEAADAGDDQALIDEEIAHIIRADPHDQAEHDERQRADDIGGRLRFRR